MEVISFSVAKIAIDKLKLFGTKIWQRRFKNKKKRKFRIVKCRLLPAEYFI